MNVKWIRFFILSAGGILLSAAVIHFIMVLEDPPLLSFPEPMFSIQLRSVMLIIGGIELLVAAICLFSKRIGLTIGLMGWLFTSYAVYGVGLFSIRYYPQISAIGTLADPLHMSRGKWGVMIEFIRLYLGFGWSFSLIWLWFKRASRTY